MPKHIKLKCVLSEDRTAAAVTILEQTHFHTDFGDLKLPKVVQIQQAVDFCHNGVRLVSHAGNIPHTQKVVSHARRTTLTCYLRGSAIQNYHTFDIYSEDWPRIKAAVEAYNEYFKE